MHRFIAFTLLTQAATALPASAQSAELGADPFAPEATAASGRRPNAELDTNVVLRSMLLPRGVLQATLGGELGHISFDPSGGGTSGAGYGSERLAIALGLTSFLDATLSGALTHSRFGTELAFAGGSVCGGLAAGSTDLMLCVDAGVSDVHPRLSSLVALRWHPNDAFALDVNVTGGAYVAGPQPFITASTALTWSPNGAWFARLGGEVDSAFAGWLAASLCSGYGFHVGDSILELTGTASIGGDDDALAVSGMVGATLLTQLF